MKNIKKIIIFVIIAIIFICSCVIEKDNQNKRDYIQKSNPCIISKQNSKLKCNL